MKDADRQLLHQFYVASRALMASGAVPDISVQRSFDGVIEGYRGEDSWRPSHITLAAAERLSVGVTTGIQRAHGILAGRMDRYARTIMILKGAELDFDAWWKVWTDNDATVLVTREEHIENRQFTPDEVLEIPRSLNLFGTGGFSFKFRKKTEAAWIRERLGR